MTLPSPIPHPLSIDAGVDAVDGRWRDAVQWVIGPDWPEGDEKALRALADQWREAARLVRPLLAEADRATRVAAAGFGGTEAAQRTRHGLASTLEVETFERLADLAEAGADEIEAAKLDICREVANLLGELENLATLEIVEPGVVAAGGGALLAGARSVVERVTRHAVAQMHELGHRAGDLRPPFAFPQLATIGDASGQHATGAPEQVGSGTSQDAPVVPAPAVSGAPADSGVNMLLMAAGIASLGGGPVQGGGGQRSVTALKGRYGERAIRGPSGAVLSEISIGVIAKEGVEWSGRAAAPPIGGPDRASSPAGLEGVRPRLAGVDRLAGVESGGGDRTRPEAGSTASGPMSHGSTVAPQAPTAAGGSTSAVAASQAVGLQRRLATPEPARQNAFALTVLPAPVAEEEPLAQTPIAPGLVVAATQEIPLARAMPPAAEPVALPDARAYEEHVRALVECQEDEAAQQLWRKTVQREAGVAQRAHQQELERAVGKDADGTAEMFPDLAGDWLRLVNGGGPLADRRRAGNSVEVAMSVLDTWLHGCPRAAIPCTPEKEEELQRLSADRQGFGKLEAALRVEGHGACALLVQEWPHGEIHATTVHNQRGEIVYADAQRAVRPLSAQPVPGAVRMGVLAFGPEGKRIDIGG